MYLLHQGNENARKKERKTEGHEMQREIHYSFQAFISRAGAFVLGHRDDKSREV